MEASRELNAILLAAWHEAETRHHEYLTPEHVLFAALAFDRPRGIVWINGNQSDSLYTFDIATEAWQQIPMPRRVTFTRDVEFEPDGTAYTAIAHFPGWHVEDGQSTLIRVQRN